MCQNQGRNTRTLDSGELGSQPRKLKNQAQVRQKRSATLTRCVHQVVQRSKGVQASELLYMVEQGVCVVFCLELSVSDSVHRSNCGEVSENLRLSPRSGRFASGSAAATPAPSAAALTRNSRRSIFFSCQILRGSTGSGCARGGSLTRARDRRQHLTMKRSLRATE
jgi:hypothetical protein